MKLNSLSLLFLASLSFTSSANEVDKMVEFSVSQMKHMGEFKSMSAATGVSESRLEKGFKTALTRCLKSNEMLHDEIEGGKLLEACMRKEVPAATGLTAEQVDALDDAEETMLPSEKLFEEMDQVTEMIFDLEDKDELTAAEEKQLTQLENKLMQLSKKQREMQRKEMKDIASDFENYHKQ